VIEHVFRPDEILKTAWRVLRPEGQLLLFVPWEKERRYRRFAREEPHHHLFSWNAQTLGNLTTAAGFRVDSAGVARFGQERFAAVWAVKLGLGRPGFRFLQRVANWYKRGMEVRVAARKPVEATP